MSSRKWLALAAWALLPLAATAQEKHSSSTTPGTAAVSGSTLEYRSVFADYRAFHEEKATPDKLWRSANEEMGILGGHAGHMKDAVGATPTVSKQEPAAAAQSGAMNHGKHHGGAHP